MVLFTDVPTGTLSYRRLQTSRLQLQAAAAGHLGDYHQLHADPLAHPHDPQARHPDRTHSRGRIAEIAADWDRDGLGYWSVLAGSRYVGVAGVRRAGFLDRSGEFQGDGGWNVYYRFTPTAWGHGFAGEVIQAAARCCGQLDPESVLRADISPTNLASIRVATKLGMILTWRGSNYAGAPELSYELPAGEFG